MGCDTEIYHLGACEWREHFVQYLDEYSIKEMNTAMSNETCPREGPEGAFTSEDMFVKMKRASEREWLIAVVVVVIVVVVRVVVVVAALLMLLLVLNVIPPILSS